MTSLKSCYGELIALTQLYLLRECSEIKNLTVSPDALLHYQKLNLSKARTEPKSAPQPQIQPKTPLKESNQTHSAPLKPPPLPPTPLQASIPSSEASSPEKAPTKNSSPLPSSLPELDKELPREKLPPATKPSAPLNTSSGLKTLVPLAPYSGPPPLFKEIQSFFQTHFHQIGLETDIPNDRTAKQKKNQWQEAEKIPPILILSFDEGVKSLAFLKNIAQAITHRLSPARVVHAPKIENEKQWETVLNAQGLQLIIASDYGLYLQPQLMQFHQEHPQEGKHFLNHIPLLLLSDLEFYFKNGKMKAYLWRAICTEFAAMKGK